MELTKEAKSAAGLDATALKYLEEMKNVVKLQG